MKTYIVKILHNGKHVDTQTVQALDEWKARTAAMAFTAVRAMGAAVTYEVKEVSA